jgi:hypothetical protein
MLYGSIQRMKAIQTVESRGYVNDGTQQLHEMTLDPTE